MLARFREGGVLEGSDAGGLNEWKGGYWGVLGGMKIRWLNSSSMELCGVEGTADMIFAVLSMVTEALISFIIVFSENPV